MPGTVAKGIILLRVLYKTLRKMYSWIESPCQEKKKGKKICIHIRTIEIECSNIFVKWSI